MTMMRRAARLLTAMAALTMGGCIGQSGGPPVCAEPIHCVCGTDLTQFIRGTVVEDSGPVEMDSRRDVQVRIDELPFPDAYPLLSPGMVIGGSLNWRSCTTPADYGVGSEVLVFDFQLGPDDSGAYSSVTQGYLTIGLDEGDVYDLGDEPTGSGRVNVSEVPMLEDPKACEALFPPPTEFTGCMDTP